MRVISASYRTDIPAFYGEWFMQRVREGYVHYYNPYRPQVITLSLRPEDVHAIVFWSRNFGPFLKHLDELDESGLDFYFHYTVTDQLPLFEKRVPPVEQVLKSFRALAERYRPDYVLWRYDPIIFSNVTPPGWHREVFAKLLAQLEGLTHRCYFSFLDIYAKVARNLKQLPRHVQIEDLSDSDKRDFVLELAEMAAQHGITLYTCNEDFVVGGPIKRGTCVDKEIIDQLCPQKARKMKVSGNRGKCGCYDSRDIGGYDTCPHGCIYCYAVRSRQLAIQRYKAHDPDHDALLKLGPKQPPTPKLQHRLLESTEPYDYETEIITPDCKCGMMHTLSDD